MNKQQLLLHLQALLQEKVAAVEAAIRSTRDSFASDTKSSAGDKHEVGRAMIQQELDQQEAQLAKIRMLQQELERVPLGRVYDRVGPGSLVVTDGGIYFIAIGMGPIQLDGDQCFVISLASPAGKALSGKCVSDVVTFGGRTITIKGIT